MRTIKKVKKFIEVNKREIEQLYTEAEGYYRKVDDVEELSEINKLLLNKLLKIVSEKEERRRKRQKDFEM